MQGACLEDDVGGTVQHPLCSWTSCCTEALEVAQEGDAVEAQEVREEVLHGADVLHEALRGMGHCVPDRVELPADGSIKRPRQRV